MYSLVTSALTLCMAGHTFNLRQIVFHVSTIISDLVTSQHCPPYILQQLRDASECIKMKRSIKGGSLMDRGSRMEETESASINQTGVNYVKCYPPHLG